MGKTPRTAKSAPAGKRSTRKNATESDNTTKNVAAALAASKSPRASRSASRSALIEVKESKKIILTAAALRLTQEQQFAKAAQMGEDDGRGDVNNKKMSPAKKSPPETLVTKEPPLEAILEAFVANPSDPDYEPEEKSDDEEVVVAPGEKKEEGREVSRARRRTYYLGVRRRWERGEIDDETYSVFGADSDCSFFEENVPLN